MKPATIMILGGSGQIGRELQHTCRCLGSILAPPRTELDLMEFESVRRHLRIHQPDIVINAAAYTAVDDAEKHKQTAECLNATLPQVLAEETQRLNSWLIHYSTDYVFDGNTNAAYRESAPTGPLNHYGHTKLDGETAIAAQSERWMIFRTQWVYGAHGKNFVNTIAQKATERPVLHVVQDQHGAPTSANLIAQATAAVLSRLNRTHDLSKAGIYHLVADGRTSWFDVAQQVTGFLRTAHPDMAIASVEPVETAHYPTPAARPKNTQLAIDKIKETFGLTLPRWDTELQSFLNAHLSQRPRHGT